MDKAHTRVPGSRPKKRGRWRMYFGLVISLLCVLGLLHIVEPQKVINSLREADPLFLLLALGAMFCSYLLRSWRWPYFFGDKAPNFPQSFRCLIIGFFANNILPARIGEFVRAHVGGKAVRISRAYVLGTIFGERLADGLAISAIFAVLFLVEVGAGKIQEAQLLLVLAAVGFAVAAIMTILVLCLRHRIFAMLESLNKRMPGHLSTYMLSRIRRFIEGLEPMLYPSRLVILILSSLGVWFIELFVYYLITRAFSQPMSMGSLSLFLAAVNFSSMIPAAPGGLGVIEGVSSLALREIGIDVNIACAMVVMQHFIQYVVVGLPGLYFVIRMGWKLPEPEEKDEEEEEVEKSGFAKVSQASHGEFGTRESVNAFREKWKAEGYSESSNVDLSVVIPAFNEENRLPKTLLSLVEYLDSRDLKYEIIVVDDGSTDETAKEARQFSALCPAVRLLRNPRNRGKGYSVRFGVTNARGDLILFLDADGSTPIEEFGRLEEAIKAGAHVAIGSRALFSTDTEVETLWHRRLIGRVFNGIVNVVLLPGIADTQCGFKLFVKPVARHIFSLQRAERFCFDVEILFLARKIGCQIIEIPVNWKDASGSKVHLIRDSVSMFIDIVRFRLRDLAGKYGEEIAVEELENGGGRLRLS